jgi:hypothetical protein
MDAPQAEIHQVGRQMIHLVVERIDGSAEYLGLMEGGGICLANSFPDEQQAEAWLQNMFSRLHPTHRCGFGCIRLPDSKFLAPMEELERMVEARDPRLP